MIKLCDMILEEQQILSSKYKIFCDMDGVLVDFENTFKSTSGGITPGDYKDKHGLDKFWELIDSKEETFWSEIEWMSDGKQLWDYIKKYKPELLSSPSRSDYSRNGKKIWVEREIPGTKLNLAYSNFKKNYAKENTILIDDRKELTDQFSQSGGIGILHTSTQNTIHQLQKIGL